MDTINNRYIEEILDRYKVVYQKNITMGDVTIDYYIPTSRFAIIIKAGAGHKDKRDKCKKLKSVKKAIYFNPKLRNDIMRCFEGCSMKYITTGEKINGKNNCTATKATLSSYDIKFAKEAKKNPTKAEKMAKKILDDKKIPYEFQKPIIACGKSYRPDFILYGKIILEIDGGYHFTQEQKLKDKEREENLKETGYQIIRFSNNEIEQEYNKIFSKTKYKKQTA